LSWLVRLVKGFVVCPNWALLPLALLRPVGAWVWEESLSPGLSRGL